MKYMELIVLQDFQEDKGIYEDVLKSAGFEFESNDITVILRVEFLPGSRGKFPDIMALFDKMGLKAGGRRSYYSEYSQDDYKNAYYYVLLFTPIYFNEINFLSTCKLCGKFVNKIDYEKRVSNVRSTRHVLNVSRGCAIFSAELKEAILREGLTGIKFYPFDKKEKYFSVSSDIDLGAHIFRETETLNFKGWCPECSNPLFEMYYGPYRYRKSNYKGEDFVKIQFPSECVVYSQKAYNFLKKYDKKIKIYSPVFIE